MSLSAISWPQAFVIITAIVSATLIVLVSMAVKMPSRRGGGPGLPSGPPTPTDRP